MTTSNLYVKLITALWLLIMPAATLAAPDADVRFRNIQTQNGLSSDDVNCVFRDSHGFMWFGTASGLNRYDGYNIRVFHSQRPDTTALRDNYVQDIQEDADGRLWIHAGDTYSVYDPATERFRWFGAGEARRLGLPAQPRLILIDGKRVWYAVGDNDIYISNQDGKATRFAATPPGSHITDMKAIPDTDNLAVVDSSGRLSVFSPNGRILAGGDYIRPLPHSAEFFLYPDNNGLIRTYSVFGTECFDPRTGRWTDDNVSRELAGISVKAMTRDDSGRLWIGTDNNGIFIVGRDGPTVRLTNTSSDAYSLPNNTVKAIYNSGDGGIWVGTYKKGVSAYYPSEYKFTVLPVADVNCIAVNPGEYTSVWVGTDHSGLMKCNYATGETTAIHDPRDSGRNAITALLTDSKGNLWIGTYLGGLKKYSDGRFEYLTTADGLASDNIWSIIEDNNGRIWLGTLDGGLQVYDPADGSFRTFDTANSGIKSDFINSLAKAADGSIYAGTSNGIARISPADFSITTFNGSRKDGKAFSNQNVNQIAVDSRGLVWVGTREGLEVYDMARDVLYDISLSERFPNPFVLGVIEGADHTMWVTVGNEIFNIAVTADSRNDIMFDIRPFGSRDGALAGTFNQRSMCLLPSGILLAGTLKGILEIDPRDIALNTAAPKVIFTGMSIKNVPVAVGRKYRGVTILPESLEYTDRITLRHDQNDLTVYFATDNYSNTGLTTYRYRLEGFDDDWITCAPGTHHATFTNLPPGSYTLSVTAVNSDGTASAEPRTIEIIILAPWWATWWAKSLYMLISLVAVALVLLYLHRRSIAKLRQRQQEELAQKTKELNQLKFKFFTNISHELRTPLTLILSPVESMLKENLPDKDRRRLNTVKANANRLLYLVNQLLDFRKNEMAGLTLHPSEGDLVASVRSACDSFRELTDRKDISLTFETSCPRLEMKYDNDKFTKILINLLSNAVKYTPDGGHITVTLGLAGTGHVAVSVADTGKGISDEDKKHIFERFYRGSDKSDLNTGTGIGLSLVYEYTKLHGGSVEVADNKPKGTVFTVILPVSQNHELEPDRTEAAQSPAPVISESAENPPAILPESGGGKKPGVLFVDDNRDLTDFLKDEFGDTYDVTIAHDGAEALDKVKSRPFDLIVTDLMMPGMDGIEFSRRLKSDPATVDIPLVMLTAKQDMGSVIEGLTLGADDYITKPFNNEVLALKMRRLIDLRRKGLKRTLIDPTPSKIEITPLDEQLIDKAVKYVEDNISRSDLSVEELAREMGMSRVHLYKKISALTGKSPVEFIRLLRLKRATQYLAESQLTVAEIAFRLGFNNPRYFSKYFKEEFGIPPSEYHSRAEN